MPPEGPENDALISMLHIKKDAGPENDALISMLHIKKDALVGGKLCFLSL